MKKSADKNSLEERKLLGDGGLGQDEIVDFIEKELKDVPVPEEEDVVREITANYLLRVNFSELTTDDKLNEIGTMLIDTFGDMKATANYFGISISTLRILIQSQYVLTEYWKEALKGIKNLADSEVLQLVKEGDKWAIGMLHKTLYKGRAKGGYNPNEFGTLGYDDETAKINQDHIKDDVDKGTPQIVIQFSGAESSPEDEDFLEGELIDTIGEG